MAEDRIKNISEAEAEAAGQSDVYSSRRTQTSESLAVGLILAFSGGFQDAYTYLMRGKVFANAQTGNVVLMSVNFIGGSWTLGLRYLLPVLAFIAGVFVADLISHWLKYSRKLHWRQWVLLFEIAVIVASGFLPDRLNIPVNVMISFSCAMQVQAFRTLRGSIYYASTMCIGNLRGGTAALVSSFFNRDRGERRIALYYFGLILVFAAGAGVCGILVRFLKFRTIWISAIALAACFILMFRRYTGAAETVRERQQT